jgi:N-acetylglucosamine-6-sulfatase
LVVNTRTLRAVLVATLALALLTGAAYAAESEAPTEEVAPDIIMVMIDDHGYLADERVLERLPNIRELFLEGGLRLNEIYDETPLCCPARATVLSGQHTLTHGIVANAVGEPDPNTTIAKALDDAGYHTYLAGKYINGKKESRHPTGWDHIMMGKNKYDPSFYIDSEFTEFEGGFVDDAVRQVAVQWLEEAPLDEPVFAYITPVAPHREVCTGKERNEKGHDCHYLPAVMEQDIGAAACADIPPYKPADYELTDTGGPPWAMPDWPDGWPLTSICESLLVVDRMVGELRDAQTERDRPVRYVFLSDNGMSWGRQGFPLKHVPPATRLPFYVAGTDIEPGDDDTLLSNIDLAPTLAAMGGTTMLAADGTSFLPLLEGAAFEGRDEVLEIMPSTEKRSYDGWAAIRTPEWRYIRWADGTEELYDLLADPGELENVVSDRSDLVADLGPRLDALIEDSLPG